MLPQRASVQAGEATTGKIAERTAQYARGATCRDIELQFTKLDAEVEIYGRAIVGRYQDFGAQEAHGGCRDLDRLLKEISAGEFDVLHVCDLGKFGDDDRIFNVLKICEHHGVSVRIPGFGVVTRFHVFALTLASRLKGHSA